MSTLDGTLTRCDPKQDYITSAFRFGNGSSKTNSEKSGVANDNSFWAVDDDGMA